MAAMYFAVASWLGVEHPFGEQLAGRGTMFGQGLVGHLAATAAVGAQFTIGHAVLRKLGWDRNLEGAAERLLFYTVTGFVAGDFIFLLLAQLDVLNSLSVGVFVLIGLGTGLGSGLSQETTTTDSPAAGLFTWSFAALLLCVLLYWLWPLLVQTALPNSDWDSALYHLPLAERYLDGEVWNSDPLFSANSFPGGVSLWYAALMAFGLESAVIPLNFLVILLNLAAAYALATRLGGRRAGVWAVLVCSGIHVLWQQGVDPRVDGFLSLFVATAVLALVVWLKDTSRAEPLFLLSISLGAAIGTKYTGVFIAGTVVLVMLAAMALLPGRARGVLTLRNASLCAALLLLPNGAYYASNALLHGDPLFPMLRGDYFELDSQPDERIAMTGALDAKLAELPRDSAVAMRVAELTKVEKTEPPATLFNWVDVYRHPQAYSTKPNHFVSPLLLLCLFLPIALPKGRPQRTGALALLAVSLMCFIGLGSQSNLIRYVLPFLLLFGVGAALVIDRVSHPAWQCAWLLAVVATLASHHTPEMRKLERLQPGLYASSNTDHVTWLTAVGYNFTRAMPVVTARINREIGSGAMSADSLILMAGEGKGHRLDCNSLPDLSWFMQRWAVELLRGDFEAEAIAQNLRKQGVTHILYNPNYFRWVITNTQISPEPVALAMVHLEAFAISQGREVFELAGMQLIEINAPGAPPFGS
ncbi:MAG: hypothetical protein ACI9QQ_000226 [Myxococcota bacterium]|jgi:hypothetical protein